MQQTVNRVSLNINETTDNKEYIQALTILSHYRQLADESAETNETSQMIHKNTHECCHTGKVLSGSVSPVSRSCQ